jgi:hypothetical protein
MFVGFLQLIIQLYPTRPTSARLTCTHVCVAFTAFIAGLIDVVVCFDFYHEVRDLYMIYDLYTRSPSHVGMDTEWYNQFLL